jgi:hypothetical protein
MLKKIGFKESRFPVKMTAGTGKVRVICLEIYRITAKFPNVKGDDKVFRKQTLESLDPLLELNWRRTI